jgi:putative transposase
VKGRKRHILVDTQGSVLKAHVHPANLSESEGGEQLLARLQGAYPRLTHLWTDQGYKPSFVAWVEAHLGWSVEVVKAPQRPRGDTGAAVCALLGDEEFARRWPPGFHVLPIRWVVERTFAWLGKQRRLAKDYEGLPQTTEAWIYLTMSRLLLRRIAQPSH